MIFLEMIFHRMLDLLTVLTPESEAISHFSALNEAHFNGVHEKNPKLHLNGFFNENIDNHKYLGTSFRNISYKISSNFSIFRNLEHNF